MNRLSDSVLLSLINRCNLIDRLSKRLHYRSSLLRTYIGLLVSSSFTDRYVKLNTLYLIDSDTSEPQHSVYELGQETLGRVTHLLLDVPYDQSMQSVMNCWFPSLQSVMYGDRVLYPGIEPKTPIFRGDDTSTIPEDASNAYMTISSPTFSNSTLRGLTLTQPNNSKIELHCPNLKYLTLEGWNCECDVSSCVNLSELIQRSCSVPSYPKSLTFLWAHRMNVEDVYKMDAPLLTELRIDRIVSSDYNVHVDRFPRSLTKLQIYSDSVRLWTGGASNLLDLSTDCRVESLSPSLTQLDTGSQLCPEAVSGCKRLKKLICVASSNMILPNTLTALHLSIIEQSRLPPVLPPRLRILTIETISHSHVVIPPEWRFNTLTSMDIDALLTAEQINSINCIDFSIRNSEEEWTHLIRGAQRHRTGRCNAEVQEDVLDCDLIDNE